MTSKLPDHSVRTRQGRSSTMVNPIRIDASQLTASPLSPSRKADSNFKTSQFPETHLHSRGIFHTPLGTTHKLPSTITSPDTSRRSSMQELPPTGLAAGPVDRTTLSLYTYTPNLSAPAATLPCNSLVPAPASNLACSRVQLSYASLPWPVKAGDYLEIRRVPGGAPRLGGPPQRTGDGEAVEGVKPNKGRDGYVFQVREDMPSVPLNQIQVPNSVANAYRLQHRQDVEVIKIANPTSANIDFIELQFSQYLGRADMWRLGMSLENTTVHVGEKVTLAGGAVRADIQGIWRGRHRYSSGIVTSKTKTIFRSKSAQTYIFISICQETYEFDEDGEQYYEKILHGFLPELFHRWTAIGASHLVTLVLFARAFYDDEDVKYMEKNEATLGLMKDHRGRWCKDFYRVVMDFERRSDWLTALPDVKRAIQRAEREVFLEFNLGQMAGKGHDGECKRLVGWWSYAFEAPVLEAINLALNPYDEHYIDRDLSRTGLTIMILTPGTGHFSVDKNLLRLTTERMIDHGIALDLVCMTKMPLHSVPLFSYMSERPKPMMDDNNEIKNKPATPDPLYYDAPHVTDRDMTECYSLAFWVYCSYYSKTHDKPFRRDRFIPRCKMYEIQMLGILDHNLTTVILPTLDWDETHSADRKEMTVEDRRSMHDEYDASLFTSGKLEWGKEALSPPSTTRSGVSTSLGTSYQSSKLLRDESKGSTPIRPTGSRAGSRDRITRESRESLLTKRLSPAVEEPYPHTILPDITGEDITGEDITGEDMPDVPVARSTMLPTQRPGSDPRSDRRRSSNEQTPLARQMRIASMTSMDTSPSHSVTSLPSGASTPKGTPAKRLKNQSSRGSFASRFASTWLFGSFSTRASPSKAMAATETVERQDVSASRIDMGNTSLPSSPALKSPSMTFPVSPALARSPLPIIDPAPRDRPCATLSPAKPKPVPHRGTQPLAIIPSHNGRLFEDEHPIARSVPRSLHNSLRLGRSLDDSWRNKTNAAYGRTSQHRTVNPCNPRESFVESGIEGGHARRWQHVRPRMTTGKQHIVKWRSLCVPACLPLTTDLMPTTEEISTYYEAHSYDIACFPDQVSFLIRPDAAQINLPLAVMKEMASQRLSQNFQFIVLPHDTVVTEEAQRAGNLAFKNLLLADSTTTGLRVGGASEVLKDANGAIYLSWSNHIHRLTFDTQKQSVTVQRFVRKIRYSTQPHAYKALVWPYHHREYQEATAMFRYPNIDAKLNFNYLDRMIAGEEDKLQSNLRFWRARYLLIPSGREPTSVAGLMPRGSQGEEYNSSEILITGTVKLLELLGKYQCKAPHEKPTPLRLLATTFDPSTCVLDEGLLGELDRLTSGKEKIEADHTLEGMTLPALADMMNRPNNGLIIRDRYWGFKVHEDSFTGDQFCQWLIASFSDVQTREQAVEWGQSLLEKGLFEHVNGTHTFQDTMFFYRLSSQYDKDAKSRTSKSWFGKTPTSSRTSAPDGSSTTGTSPVARASLKITDKPAKKRKVKMSQSIVIDLDPHRKSDRAEVAMLHSDIVHNSRNAFHFELNWLGVTAGLLDDLRFKCSTLAERYGLRFVEAPVEQIKDVGAKCAFRAPLQIPLALPPPVYPDLHLRLADTTGPAQCAQYFEYQILTQKFGFVLDVEASDRYPENIDADYVYRSKTRFEYSQFIHRSGLALVQVLGKERGFLWVDNRPFISAPTRGRGQSMQGDQVITPMTSKQEQAKALRLEFMAFCANRSSLLKFYDEITPALPIEVALAAHSVDLGRSDGDVTPPDAWAGF
ncbi:hypothetical protein CspeluHIS016_0207530 [Cutaneotrichosporon spelunceum]|uniref:Vacuolar membrane-associated protein IML1 n=1 Tax=Cutaneotrichosporon spelunceum TaxID=1672016 RepID=A0AAD3TRV2_9TREE|nr:hypothetical protein CspeluHIS016_0207530 [Cutaneotrichosporon spelunceum]